MHKLSNIRFNADKRDYAHLQIKRMLAAEYDYDTLRIFSSGTDKWSDTISVFEKKLVVSLLQIGGADARSLAEIKRRHATECTSCTFCGYEFSLTSKLVANLHYGHPCPF